ncbi:glycosyltransferase family 2 protein [Flavobacterium sp. xlx-214]|uniref:glycosyltransferase family 2 protein n=1 Tax=unclassified Flavobacterium TaxID=196869 RepID=UPI0013D1B1B9|nr:MULTISPECIES: glycosyltransferase family 2 protein [unclassified Flavobacterium]MBA5791343.1 glycosyltransferase family 2 protein [Flavobacterium sp. xlx-221]QMI83501.1 glycosyltransferase family 2 protein [Flavobacterium sp. xlx-214]
MQLSVIILNYNVKHFLEACISSVQKAIATLDAEIIVVDNASTDGSKEMMKDVFPTITYLYQTTNAGFPKGNNIGVTKAKGKYICILNPDTIVAGNTFEAILKHITTLPNFGILGCKLIDGSGNFLPESKRGIPTPWVAFTKVTGLYNVFPKIKLFNQYYAQDIDENENGKVSILVGAFMFLEKQLYEKVGGFDEDCFMYSDDIDLSYLSLKEGKQNYYFSDVRCIHFKGESTLKDGTYMKRFKEAMQFFYKKHFKVSPFFNGMMNLGITLFAFKKKTEKRQKVKQPDHYILVSKNATVYNQLKQKYHFSIDWVQYLEDVLTLDNPQKTIEVLVDNATVSYQDYINFIEKNKKSNKTFKIKPENAPFFVGSNHKNDKGEILEVHY